MTKAPSETRTSSTKAHSPTTASPLIRILAPALVFTAIAGPAFASACSDQIATIERRLNSSGAVSVTGTASADGKVATNPSMGLDAPPGGKPTDASTTPQCQEHRPRPSPDRSGAQARSGRRCQGLREHDDRGQEGGGLAAVAEGPVAPAFGARTERGRPSRCEGRPLSWLGLTLDSLSLTHRGPSARPRGGGHPPDLTAPDLCVRGGEAGSQ